MNDMLIYILLIITAYLLGSIPNSVWIGKLFYNTDVREHGSGNAGATNTIRVLGLKAGIPVLLLDALKGYLAVSLFYFSNFIDFSFNQVIILKIALGAAAIIGHILPVYARFRGGKGVAALLGVFLAIIPFGTLISLGVFIIIFGISRYVSVGSITAGIFFPIIIHFLYPESILLLIVSIIVSILLLFTHRKNISRLLKGTENRFNFKSTKS